MNKSETFLKSFSSVNLSQVKDLKCNKIIIKIFFLSQYTFTPSLIIYIYYLIDLTSPKLFDFAVDFSPNQMELCTVVTVVPSETPGTNCHLTATISRWTWFQIFFLWNWFPLFHHYLFLNLEPCLITDTLIMSLAPAIVLS